MKCDDGQRGVARHDFYLEFCVHENWLTLCLFGSPGVFQVSISQTFKRVRIAKFLLESNSNRIGPNSCQNVENKNGIGVRKALFVMSTKSQTAEK